VRWWRVQGALGLGIAVVFLAMAPSPAEAKLKTVVVNHGPFELGPYQVRYTSNSNRGVRAPKLGGYIVRMYARVVDKRGRPLPVRKIMLHHVLYKNVGRYAGDRREPICGHSGESFYGTGEENQPLRLPRGYGYRIRKGDRWRIAWMLMNHQSRPGKAYIQYRAVVETERKLRPVTPYWARVTGCKHAIDPIFDVPGGGAKGSMAFRHDRFSLPRSGRLVAANGHLHGGAYGLRITQPGCGDRPLMTSRPLYGMRNHPYYKVLPVLHEPGPIATSWAQSRSEIPVGANEPLEVWSAYDAERAHTRVMGIMHLYVDHSRPTAASCGPLPADLREPMPRMRGRVRPPRVTVPLTGLDKRGQARTIVKPPGALQTYTGDAAVGVRRARYSVRNLSVPLGAMVSWRFGDPVWHDVTMANGPEGFSSPLERQGTSFSKRFTKPGFYQLYCSLHPVRMTQTVRVREGS